MQGGWDLWLDRKRYAQKLCEKDFACQVPDGRYYVVRGACSYPDIDSTPLSWSSDLI